MPRKSRDRAEWERAKYAEATKRVPERAKFETTYGAPLPPIYDTGGADPGFPGEPPFTRGVQPTMYRGRLWTMRQYAGFGTAEESNARYRYLLAHGQTGLSVAFDLPTQMGYDADDPSVAGEVGKVGVSISSLDDFARLFEGIPMGEVTTSMTINATAAILLAMYVAVAKRQGVAADRVAGTTQNDILKEYIARGTYIFPPRPSMRLATDLIAYCAERHPRWNPISISGYHIREAGADAVQELAFTFADAIAYVDAAVERGLDVDRFAPQLSFFFAAHSTLLEEVAKFRAARRIYARLMRPVRREGPGVARAPVPHADDGLDADRTAAAEQHRSHRDRGARRGARGNAVAPHECIRRGARPSHRRVRAYRVADTADHR